MITISGKLANILIKISKYDYDEPLLVKDTDAVMVKAMDNTRTALFIARVKDNIPELPEKALINLPEAIFNKNVVYIKDVIEDAEVIGEPDIELTTTLITRVNSVLEVLEQCRKDSLSIALFKPDNDKLTISIRYEYEDEPINHELQYDARVLEGKDIGMFRCDLLHRQLRLLKSLGITVIKIRYALKLPMLITLYSKEFPRVWVAPYVGDE